MKGSVPGRRQQWGSGHQGMLKPRPRWMCPQPSACLLLSAQSLNTNQEGRSRQQIPPVKMPPDVSVQLGKGIAAMGVILGKNSIFH